MEMFFGYIFGKTRGTAYWDYSWEEGLEEFQCLSLGSCWEKYALACSEVKFSFDIWSIRKANNSSIFLYTKFPSV